MLVLTHFLCYPKHVFILLNGFACHGEMQETLKIFFLHWMLTSDVFLNLRILVLSSVIGLLYVHCSFLHPTEQACGPPPFRCAGIGSRVAQLARAERCALHFTSDIWSNQGRDHCLSFLHSTLVVVRGDRHKHLPISCRP